MAAQRGQDQFETEVFPAELHEIAARRKNVLDAWQPADAADVASKEEFAAKLEDLHTEIEANAKPSTKPGLVGLALSDDGLRSATSSLGVVQALSRYDLLKYVDYLSTVSGGGYIGSCLTALLTSNATFGVRPQTSPTQPCPLGFMEGENETLAVHHLRAYSSRIAPQFNLLCFDTWRLIGWYIGALFCNLPAPLCAIAFLLTLGIVIISNLQKSPDFPGSPSWLVGLAVLIAIVYIVYFVRLYRAKRKQARDLRSRRAGQALLYICAPLFLFSAPYLYSCLLSATELASTVNILTFTRNLTYVGILLKAPAAGGPQLVKGNTSEFMQALKWSGVRLASFSAGQEFLSQRLTEAGIVQTDGSINAPLPDVLYGLETAGLWLTSASAGPVLSSALGAFSPLLLGLFPAAFTGYFNRSTRNGLK